MVRLILCSLLSWDVLGMSSNWLNAIKTGGIQFTFWKFFSICLPGVAWPFSVVLTCGLYNTHPQPFSCSLATASGLNAAVHVGPD